MHGVQHLHLVWDIDGVEKIYLLQNGNVMLMKTLQVPMVDEVHGRHG